MPDDTVQIAIEAVDNASDKIEAVAKELDTLDGTTKKSAESQRDSAQAAQTQRSALDGLGGAIVVANQAIGLFNTSLAAVKQVWDFGKEGAENQRIAESFKRTAASIGASADDIVAKLDAAAKGTVDDEELMQASTRALTLGVAKSGDDLVNVMKLARAAALQFGGDAGQAFETINYAIGNLAPRALKQYGIIVDLKDATKEYADKNGLLVNSLTEAQQRQALLNAVLEQGKKNFGDIADSAATTGEKMKAVETRLQNVLDVVKEIAATGFGTGLDITDAPKNAMEAFIGTAQKMKADVAAGKMSVEDYNKALRGMANTLTAVLPGAFADAAYNDYKLNDSFKQSTQGAYALSGALDESARAARRSADAQAAEAVRQAQAQDAAQKHTSIMREYSRQLLANAEAYQRTKINIADTTTLAIAYTEAQRKQGDVQKELDKLNEQIASHGAKRNVTIKNEKMSAEELARTQLQLKVAQEDLSGAQKKANETDAEYALRLDTLKGKVSDYSAKLGEHTAVVGGATKAELEHKAALEGQIAELQKTDEINRAKGAFEALTAAFRSGALTEDQFKERSAALNSVANLYTESALKQATAQEVLMKSFADPRSETWRGQLLKNEAAIDGVTKKTTEAKDAFGEYIQKLMQPVTVDVKIKPAIVDTGDDKTRAAARDKAITAAETSSTKALSSVTGAAKQTTGAVSSSADIVEGRLTALATTTQTKFTTVANSIVGAFRVAGSQAGIDLFGIYQAVENLPTYKEFVYKITVKGEVPSGGIPGHGAQYGADFIVPPNPRGGSSDYFPVMAAPGERVIVQTKAQQAGGAASKGGDTFNYVYNTNVYNPLAAAMLADKQRRERLGRSNARMGV